MKQQSTSPEDGEKKQTQYHGDKGATGRKVTLTKESVKRYKVTVIYIPVSEEEAKIKRAIIETIMKKPPQK